MKEQMTTCSRCGKAVKRVLKQDPDMPKGIKAAFPAAHVCVNGQPYKA